jgi:hypothetical protein
MEVDFVVLFQVDHILSLLIRLYCGLRFGITCSVINGGINYVYSSLALHLDCDPSSGIIEQPIRYSLLGY